MGGLPSPRGRGSWFGIFLASLLPLSFVFLSLRTMEIVRSTSMSMEAFVQLGHFGTVSFRIFSIRRDDAGLGREGKGRSDDGQVGSTIAKGRTSS